MPRVTFLNKAVRFAAAPNRDTPMTAMVFAAGLGTRMRPLTDDLPKPLVPVLGRTLLDRALDRLEMAGVHRVVINLHYRGDQIRDHLAARGGGLDIVYSDESGERLETGGGLAKALPLLGEDPFFVINSDVIWEDGIFDTLHRLAARWDGDQMDALLLTVSTPLAIGYDGRGDFQMDALGRLSRREESRVAPFVYAGVQMVHPRLIADCPTGSFSLNLLWDRAIEAGRLFGLRHDGVWLHVGDPPGLEMAERVLRDLG